MLMLLQQGVEAAVWLSGGLGDLAVGVSLSDLCNGLLGDAPGIVPQ